MPWNGNATGGFMNITGNEPWLPLYPNYQDINVQVHTVYTIQILSTVNSLKLFLGSEFHSVDIKELPETHDY